MSTIALVIFGAILGSVIWIFVLAWCFDLIGVQRKQLSDQALTLRLYRESRDESDRQVRDLLGQNGRLAAKLIELAAREAELTAQRQPRPEPILHAQLWPAARES